MQRTPHRITDTRPSARERGYGAAWDRARAGFLRLHPHCAECAKEGLIVRATVVDHVVPHRGDQRLFWDSGNWQSLCTNHHSSDKQHREKRGFSSRVRNDGLPSDGGHPFYAGQDASSTAGARQQPPQAPQAASGETGGGSEVVGSKGRGPLGYPRAELVSGSGSKDLSGGAAARPHTSGDRTFGSAVVAIAPSIVASPSTIRGRRDG